MQRSVGEVWQTGMEGSGRWSWEKSSVAPFCGGQEGNIILCPGLARVDAGVLRVVQPICIMRF